MCGSELFNLADEGTPHLHNYTTVMSRHVTSRHVTDDLTAQQHTVNTPHLTGLQTDTALTTKAKHTAVQDLYHYSAYDCIFIQFMTVSSFSS
jgi:hypothetical protein